MNHVELLKHLGASDNALSLATEYPDMRSTWEDCDNPDWLLWLLARIGFDSDYIYRKFAVLCMTNTPLCDGLWLCDLLHDPRSLKAVSHALLLDKDELVKLGEEAWLAAGDPIGIMAWTCTWANGRDAAFAVMWRSRMLAASYAIGTLEGVGTWEPVPKEQIEEATKKAIQAAKQAQAKELHNLIHFDLIEPLLKKQEEDMCPF